MFPPTEPNPIFLENILHILIQSRDGDNPRRPSRSSPNLPPIMERIINHLVSESEARP